MERKLSQVIGCVFIFSEARSQCLPCLAEVEPWKKNLFSHFWEGGGGGMPPTVGWTTRWIVDSNGEGI